MRLSVCWAGRPLRCWRLCDGDFAALAAAPTASNFNRGTLPLHVVERFLLLSEAYSGSCFLVLAEYMLKPRYGPIYQAMLSRWKKVSPEQDFAKANDRVMLQPLPKRGTLRNHRKTNPYEHKKHDDETRSSSKTRTKTNPYDHDDETRSSTTKTRTKQQQDHEKYAHKPVFYFCTHTILD